MPSVPMEMPSDTPMVLKRYPTMPAFWGNCNTQRKSAVLSFDLSRATQASAERRGGRERRERRRSARRSP
eukprot:1852747-Rhodomonas_salina.2